MSSPSASDKMTYMRRVIAGLALFGLGFSAVFAAVEVPAAAHLKGLTWLGHASFRLERAGVVVYFDPWKIEGEPHDGDLILITHPHFDHFSQPDVAKVAKPDAEIVTVRDCVQKLRDAGFSGAIRVLKPGDKVEVRGVPVEAVPAYNTDKNFHPKENNWAGFILELDGVRFYHAGDTDPIPEMSTFKVDVALLPVSGTYVMTSKQAAAAAKVLQPRVAVPMHYGSIVGTEADAKRFRSLAGGVVVEILEKNTVRSE